MVVFVIGGYSMSIMCREIVKFDLRCEGWRCIYFCMYCLYIVCVNTSVPVSSVCGKGGIKMEGYHHFRGLNTVSVAALPSAH